MLKYGEVVTDGMHAICNLAWKKWKMPGDKTKATTVSIYTGKGNKNDCGN